jgi:hypothetical protein
MIDVALYLFEKIGGTAAELTVNIDVTRDAPMTVCKQLLGAANVRVVMIQKLNFVVEFALLLGCWHCRGGPV